MYGLTKQEKTEAAFGAATGTGLAGLMAIDAHRQFRDASSMAKQQAEMIKGALAGLTRDEFKQVSEIAENSVANAPTIADSVQNALSGTRLALAKQQLNVADGMTSQIIPRRLLGAGLIAGTALIGIPSVLTGASLAMDAWKNRG